MGIINLIEIKACSTPDSFKKDCFPQLTKINF